MEKLEEEAHKFAKEHKIYVNEARRVLKGELTLEEAIAIRDEYLSYVKDGTVQPWPDRETSYLNECLRFMD